jgi:hypothetical protein
MAKTDSEFNMVRYGDRFQKLLTLDKLEFN